MLLGFKKRFKEPILQLTKVFTMRGKRKNDPKIGETLYMYTGLRTANCELTSNQEKLISVQKVLIDMWVDTFVMKELCIYVDNRKLTTDEVEQFVKYDGFIDKKDFAEYWIDGCKKDLKKRGYLKGRCELCWELELFHWTDLRY